MLFPGSEWQRCKFRTGTGRMGTKQDSHCCSVQDGDKVVSECLQQMLKVIEEGDELVSMATWNQNPNSRNIPGSSSMEQKTDEGTKVLVTDPPGTSQENSGESESSTHVDIDRQPAELDMRHLLPHEGSRWVQLRDRMATEPQFEEYSGRVQDDRQYWSLDEAFVSFCLDRVEEVLASAALPTACQRQATGIQKTNKVTRRKGQPRKYERTPNSATIQAEKNLYADTNFLVDAFEDDFENEDDVISLDDNPDDLDYRPLSIIRYKKTPSRKLPRRNSSRRSKDEITMVSIEIPNDDDSSSVVVERIPKPSKPKRRLPKLTKPKADQGPPRKRGRPRKNPDDLAKNKCKKGRPRMTAEQKMAKKKTYNESRTRLQLEVLRESLPRSLRCRTCVEQFTDTDDMIVHYFEVHRQQSISEQDREDKRSAYNTCRLADVAAVLRECPDCKEFVENMPLHSREHLPRNVICEECGKLFLTRRQLNVHMRVHKMDRTGERLHCDKCDKSYRCAASLQRHQLIHAGKKTFICDQCGKDFFNSVRLRVHRAVHMKEKPYKCSECGRGFTQLTNLRSHERVHTGIKPYKCEHCEESFTHKVSMKMHQKKKHGIDWWKENGVPVQARKSTKKTSAAGRKSADKETAKTQTLAEQPLAHPDDAARSCRYASNLITHGSKTYAQLERKTNLTETFHPLMSPFEHTWRT